MIMRRLRPKWSTKCRALGIEADSRGFSHDMAPARMTSAKVRPKLQFIGIYSVGAICQICGSRR
jgi:hypothetical protein